MSSLARQVEKQQHKFLHRLHMMHFDSVSLSELLDRINASKYREKDEEEAAVRIGKKGDGCRFARSRSEGL